MPPTLERSQLLHFIPILFCTFLSPWERDIDTNSPAEEITTNNPAYSGPQLPATMNADQPGEHVRLPWEARDHSKLHSHTSGSLDGGESNAPMMRRRSIPILSSCSKEVKNHLVAMLSEFVGTFLFLLFAFGGTNAVNDPTVVDSPGNPAKLLYISLCFGMSLMVNGVCKSSFLSQSSIHAV